MSPLLLLTISMIFNLLSASTVVIFPIIPGWFLFERVILNSEGLGSTNVIPDKVRLKGTLRAMDEDFRAIAHKRMQKIALDVAKYYELEIDFDIRISGSLVLTLSLVGQLAKYINKSYIKCLLKSSKKSKKLKTIEGKKKLIKKVTFDQAFWGTVSSWGPAKEKSPLRSAGPLK